MAQLGIVDVDVGKVVQRYGTLTVRLKSRGLSRLRWQFAAVKFLLWLMRIVAPCDLVIKGAKLLREGERSDGICRP